MSFLNIDAYDSNQFYQNRYPKERLADDYLLIKYRL